MQGSLDIVDTLNSMSQENKDALNEVLGSREGVIDLSTLASKGKAAVEKAGLTIKSGLKSILKKVFKYLSPLIALAISILIMYKGIKRCLKKKRRNVNQSSSPEELPQTKRLSLAEARPTNAGQSSNAETISLQRRLSLEETRQINHDGRIQELNKRTIRWWPRS